MKSKVLVTREVFDETLDFLAQHCEVESNQRDAAFDPETLASKLADKDGVICCLADRIDAKLLERCPRLKVAANVAVGYNNIDLPACTARKVMVTNTPGVLNDSTADLAWALLLGAARRLTELERRVRAGEWTGLPACSVSARRAVAISGNLPLRQVILELNFSAAGNLPALEFRGPL